MSTAQRAYVANTVRLHLHLDGLALRLGLLRAAHIGMDRALGFGYKYPIAFDDTDIGRAECRTARPPPVAGKPDALRIRARARLRFVAGRPRPVVALGSRMAESTHGVVLGRFMPPHNGHRYLIDFAARCVDRLSVLVGTLSSDPIDGLLRYRWMREMFPDVNVIHITEENPRARKGSPDSYRIWARGITENAGSDIRYVFASEDYGFRLAEELGAVYVPVDPARTVFPVSASMVRRNPMGTWEFIPPTVRPYFVRRVYVLSEETGASEALLERLADHFHTVSVGDYVAYHAERIGPGSLSPEFAVRAQGAAEEALARQAARVLFSASDQVHAWTRVVGPAAGHDPGHPAAGGGPPTPAATHDWEHSCYLINLPVRAGHDSLTDHEKLPVLARTLETLAERSADIRVLTGDANERFSQAVEIVDELLDR